MFKAKKKCVKPQVSKREKPNPKRQTNNADTGAGITNDGEFAAEGLSQKKETRIVKG